MTEYCNLFFTLIEKCKFTEWLLLLLIIAKKRTKKKSKKKNGWWNDRKEQKISSVAGESFLDLLGAMPLRYELCIMGILLRTIRIYWDWRKDCLKGKIIFLGEIDTKSLEL